MHNGKLYITSEFLNVNKFKSLKVTCDTRQTIVSLQYSKLYQLHGRQNKSGKRKQCEKQNLCRHQSSLNLLEMSKVHCNYKTDKIS